MHKRRGKQHSARFARRTRPYVIEVNDFPTYSAVPGAAIAQHVLALTRINTVAQEMGSERMLSIVRSPS